MFKFILFFILFYFVFKLLKDVFSGNESWRHTQQNFAHGKPGIQASEMVQDPVCMVYIPKSGALTTVKSGKTYYFCSMECLEKFRTGNIH